MRVCLLFTFGVSLNLWEDKGILEREILLYKKLQEKDVDISFLTHGGKKDLKYSNILNGIEVIPTLKLTESRNDTISLLKSFLLPIKLRKLFRSIDIIKTNQLKGWWIAGIAKVLYRKPLIIRGGYERLVKYFLEYKSKKKIFFFKYIYNYARIFLNDLLAYKLANRIILTSDLDIDFITKTFKLNKKKAKIHHISNYIDIDLFKPLNLDKKERSVLFIGKFSYQKNILNLLKAFKNLNNFSLSIIGKGPLEKSIRNYIIENNLNINLLGIVPNRKIPEIINQHEIFVLPSHWEGNPKVLLEAMSCGVPCIGSNVWGINNIIHHRKNGYLCKKSAKSIRNAILTIYNNKILRDRISKNARDFVIKNCSLDLIVSKEFLIYKHVLKQN